MNKSAAQKAPVSMLRAAVANLLAKPAQWKAPPSSGSRRQDARYVRALSEWEDRLGSARLQAYNWRLAFFGALALSFMLAAGLIHLKTQPRAVPYVIQVDKLGEVAFRGDLGKLGTDFTLTPAIVKTHVRRFVSCTRGVSSDTAVVKRCLLEAWNTATPKAQRSLNTYIQTTQPLRRSSEGERVTIEMVAAVQVSAETWQVDWRETSWDVRGNPRGEPVLWRGMFTLVRRQPESEEQMALNPLGLFVDEYHWDRVRN